MTLHQAADNATIVHHARLLQAPAECYADFSRPIRTHIIISTCTHYINTLLVYKVFRYYNCNHVILVCHHQYILNVVFECFTLAEILCMFLTGCHAFPFPATRGHLPRGATFAPNWRWPLVADTTVQGTESNIHNK